MKYLFSARRHDNNVALASLLVGARADAGGGIAEERAVREILDLSIAELFLGVYKQDLAGDGIEEKGACDGGSDCSGSDDCDLACQRSCRGHNDRLYCSSRYQVSDFFCKA